jgi:transposase
VFRLDEALKVLVEKALGLDPFAACVYVFSNRRRNRVKILGWDRNGFWLLLKRLEQDRFIRPAVEVVPTLTAEQLHWLLEGIDIGAVQRHFDKALGGNRHHDAVKSHLGESFSQPNGLHV